MGGLLSICHPLSTTSFFELMCMCVHAYTYVQVAMRARRGYQIPCCEPCKVASALNPPNHLSNPDITLFNFCPVPAQKKWQIHNPHSDYIWSIIAMTSEEQKKITHIYEALCAILKQK